MAPRPRDIVEKTRNHVLFQKSPQINISTRSRRKFRRIMRNQYMAHKAARRLTLENVDAITCTWYCCLRARIAVALKFALYPREALTMSWRTKSSGDSSMALVLSSPSASRIVRPAYWSRSPSRPMSGSVGIILRGSCTCANNSSCRNRHGDASEQQHRCADCYQYASSCERALMAEHPLKTTAKRSD